MAHFFALSASVNPSQSPAMRPIYFPDRTKKLHKSSAIPMRAHETENISMAGKKVIVIPDGKICDYIDGKQRNDTPEEYVRQTIEKRLVNEHKYRPGQIKIEYTLHVGANKPRADIVIWDKEDDEKSQANVKLIIECKKETVDARNAKDGIAQLQSYMSVCPNCDWGMWTNSVQKYVFRKVVDAAGNISFMEYNDIPAADGNLDEVNRPSRTGLKNAYDDNLLFVFKTCHNHIYVNDGFQKQPAFFELLKVIFCKIEDERNIPNPLEFYTTSEERSNPDGQLTVQKRILIASSQALISMRIPSSRAMGRRPLSSSCKRRRRNRRTKRKRAASSPTTTYL